MWINLMYYLVTYKGYNKGMYKIIMYRSCEKLILLHRFYILLDAISSGFSRISLYFIFININI